MINVVYHDLLFLTEFTKPDCSENQLRRASVELRKLISDDYLIRCWKLLIIDPKSPHIMAPMLKTDSLDPSALSFAGGGQTGGSSIANVRIWNRALNAEEMKKVFENERENMANISYPFPINEFKDSCCIYYKDTRIKRAEVIKYVANKLGGAHYDGKKRRDKEVYTLLDEICVSRFTFGGEFDETKPMSPKGGKNPIYMEMLSFGQNIVNSPDIQKFMTICKQTFSI